MRRLLIRPGAIGDCILGFPALESLKADYTEVWLPSSAVPLVQFAGAVRSLSSTSIDLAGLGGLEMPPRLYESLKSFDSIVSWYGAKREEFRQAIFETGVPCEFHPALPPAGYAGHATDFFASQVGAPQGLSPHIEVKPAQCRNSIVIHPFSGGVRKNWPLENYRRLADGLPLKIDWTCGPEEELPGATRFADLASLASWIRGARLYIGNDSGITHLAAAAGCPTLALFGPTNPAVWAPRGRNVRVLHSRSLTDLTVETVLAAANRLLDSLS
ncbi:MAG: glycosyltransferase family 9 protein [Acidobacteriaceae bacterium]|nr:glycosyltransferase family 9 protein [Acidobacteriaceae bacterium]